MNSIPAIRLMDLLGRFGLEIILPSVFKIWSGHHLTRKRALFGSEFSPDLRLWIESAIRSTSIRSKPFPEGPLHYRRQKLERDEVSFSTQPGLETDPAVCFFGPLPAK